MRFRPWAIGVLLYGFAAFSHPALMTVPRHSKEEMILFAFFDMALFSAGLFLSMFKLVTTPMRGGRRALCVTAWLAALLFAMWAVIDDLPP